jgi:alpha-1,2-mannosyltransferase
VVVQTAVVSRRFDGLRRAAAQLVPLVAFAILPVVIYAYAFAKAPLFFDFEVFWSAGRDVLAGRSPYPPVDAAVLSTEANFVYPAVAAYLMAPLSLLPLAQAGAIFTLLAIGAVPLALWLLGVRDWRCYGAAVVSAPILHGAVVGAISALLALALAVVWRWRDRPLVVAPLVALLVVSKVFLWPLGLWLLVTRRVRSAFAAAGIAVVAAFAGWAALGFAGLADYPQLLALLSDLLAEKGYSPVALGLSLGAPESAAKLLAYVTGAVAVAACVALARRRSQEADLASLCAALAAALLLSPIVWTHYLTVLFVPIAVVRQRLSGLWLVPLVLWATPAQSDGLAWRVVVGFVVMLAPLVWIAYESRRRRSLAAASRELQLAAAAQA